MAAATYYKIWGDEWRVKAEKAMQCAWGSGRVTI